MPLKNKKRSIETTNKIISTKRKNLENKLIMKGDLIYKECSHCREIKLLNQEYYPNKTKIFGFESACKQCKLKQHKEYLYNGGRNKFNISLDDYYKMLIAQNSVCAICLKSSSSFLCVDHDHATGTTRGLLCKRRNSTIAFLNDSSENCWRAKEYLSK